LLVGYGLGLFVAAQIGPVSLLIVRSAVRGNFRIGFAMGAAVALVDLGYAALGLAGVARGLEATDGVRLTLGFVGAAVLGALGLRSMWIGFRARFGLETEEEVGMPKRAFATAFAATALNPLTIALWTAAPRGGLGRSAVLGRHGRAAGGCRLRNVDLVHGVRGRDRTRSAPNRAAAPRSDRHRRRRRDPRLRRLPRVSDRPKLGRVLRQGEREDD